MVKQNNNNKRNMIFFYGGFNFEYDFEQYLKSQRKRVEIKVWQEFRSQFWIELNLNQTMNNRIEIKS